MNTAQSLRPYSAERDWERCHAPQPGRSPDLCTITPSIRTNALMAKNERDDPPDPEPVVVAPPPKPAPRVREARPVRPVRPLPVIGAGGFVVGTQCERVASVIQAAGPESRLNSTEIAERAAAPITSVASILHKMFHAGQIGRDGVRKLFRYWWIR